VFDEETVFEVVPLPVSTGLYITEVDVDGL
jgi:hypothetical protein